MSADWFADLLQKTLAKHGKKGLHDPRLIHLAVTLGQMDLLLWLLEQGASVHARDRRGRTPIFHARDERMVHTLVEAGARLDARDLMHHAPLQAAVKAGRLDVAQAMIQLGADVHAQDKRGLTALHTAAVKGRGRCIEHLLEQGAWVNHRDRHGRTPLFYAVAAGHLDTALLLIESGADLTMLDDRGTSWLHLARMDQVMPLQQACDQALAHDAYDDWMPDSIHRSQPQAEQAEPTRMIMTR